jgi:uncharacterized membrane protein
MSHSSSASQTRTAGLLLGVGLGGFVDGIALHQIAQWHNMLSARVPPNTMHTMGLNMRADGWFHAAVFVVTLAGVVTLYRAARRGAPFPPFRWFVGLLLGGWGGFNLVEGVIDHHILQLHHVRDLPMHVPAYDDAFLALGGFGLVALGWLLTRGQLEVPLGNGAGAA